MMNTPDISKSIYPNFIYNRFDLYNACVYQYRYGADKIVPVIVNKDCAELGLWLTKIEKPQLTVIIKAIFAEHRDVKRIHYVNGYIATGNRIKKNHFRIFLPSTVEELEGRLSKKSRYNINRECKLLEQNAGTVRIIEYTVDNVPKEVFDEYFKLKKHTHNIDYNMTKDEYISKYHVTNVYVMFAGDHIVSIVLSCEQCNIVYIENLTYNTNYAQFSPGQILYDKYLKILVGKGKNELFLAGGNLDYKRRYGSVEEIVYECTVYKNKVMQVVVSILDFAKKTAKKILGRA